MAHRDNASSLSHSIAHSPPVFLYLHYSHFSCQGVPAESSQQLTVWNNFPPVLLQPPTIMYHPFCLRTPPHLMPFKSNQVYCSGTGTMKVLFAETSQVPRLKQHTKKHKSCMVKLSEQIRDLCKTCFCEWQGEWSLPHQFSCGRLDQQSN